MCIELNDDFAQQIAEKPVDPVIEARKVRANTTYDALRTRATQQELYEGVVFAPDHLVSQDRMIPLFPNELILRAGHLDILYQLGVIEDKDLYKITQTSLREGVQGAAKVIIRLKEMIQDSLMPDEDREKQRDTIILRKTEDQVCAKINLAKTLRKAAFTHPDIQSIFLELVHQELGNNSLAGLVHITQKEIQAFRAKPGTSDELRQLMIEVEIKVRRIVTQELSIHAFLQQVAKDRPEMQEIYKLDGVTRVVDKIDQGLSKDLGPNRDGMQVEPIVKRVMDYLAKSSPPTFRPMK